jgi:hypothetical protein
MLRAAIIAKLWKVVHLQEGLELAALLLRLTPTFLGLPLGRLVGAISTA